MDQGTLDDRYLEWLYKSIGSVSNKNPNRSYWKMANQLYRKPFRWIIPNDDNRAEDGKYLREEFISELHIMDVDNGWFALECSVLEMLIALSRRTSFESQGTPGDWYWKFLDNLGLRSYTDAVYDEAVALEIDAAIDLLLERKYKRNGAGGLFPLQNATRDQRKVELWYQMSMYLLEGEYIDHGP